MLHVKNRLTIGSRSSYITVRGSQMHSVQEEDLSQGDQLCGRQMPSLSARPAERKTVI